AGTGNVIHAEEVRGVNHRRKDVAELGHANDVLPGVGEINLPLPGHDAEDVERKQNAFRMERRIGATKEISNDVGALPFRMRLHETELGVFLIALSREAD